MFKFKVGDVIVEEHDPIGGSTWTILELRYEPKEYYAEYTHKSNGTKYSSEYCVYEMELNSRALTPLEIAMR